MFGLTEEQLQLQREVRTFAAREIAPHVSEWDEGSIFPAAAVKKLGEMGLLGVIFPESLGGAGLGYVEYVLAIEELSRVDGSVGIIVAAHNSLCTNHIMLGGNDEQRQRWIPKLATGEWLGAWGLTEPGSGSDAGGARTTATRKGDGWVLNGSKTFITNGSYANCAVVLAVTDREKGTHGGISAFLVEKGTPGFRPGKKENKLGLRASDTAELIFENCLVPNENLLGAVGAGFKDAMRVLDGGRISIAALSLGIGRGALDAAMKYATQRKQFGKAIADFQAIQFKLATMATELDAAWLLTMRAAQMKDAGKKVTLESSMAKLYASEAACRICDEGVQIHGGYGFIKDYPAEKFYRDVKLCTIGEGTSEIQRMVIARELLKPFVENGISACRETYQRDRMTREDSSAMRIGVDLGGTKIEALAMDSAGHELARYRVDTPRGDYPGTIAAIVGLVERLESEIGQRGSVGVGIPGTVERSNGLVKNANSTWLNGERFDKDLSAALGREARVANDANCFVVSEATDGAAAGVEVVFGVILDTGCGGGIAINGGVHAGHGGLGGEWGHNPLPWPTEGEFPGPDCYCGKHGCLEKWISGTGFMGDYERHSGKLLIGAEIVKLSERGDRLALETLARLENRIARGLAIVINVLDPDAIVIGGGVSRIDRIYAAVSRQLPQYVFGGRCDTPILKAMHGDSSGVRGAAWLWPKGSVQE